MPANYTPNIFISEKVVELQKVSVALASCTRVNMDLIPGVCGGDAGTLLISLTEEEVDKICEYFLKAEDKLNKGLVIEFEPKKASVRQSSLQGIESIVIHIP